MIATVPAVLACDITDYLTQMANNYDRLFSELTSLLADEDVLQRIDEALGERIRSVLKNH